MMNILRPKPKLKATEVFTPGAFPEHTYVAREGAVLEQALADAIDTPGQIVSLVGPSKSGKTVLVEKVVGDDNLITITGARINTPNDIWANVCDHLDVPDSATTTDGSTTKVGGEVEGKGAASLLLGSITAGAKVSAGKDKQSTQAQTSKRRGLDQVVELIGGTDFVLLVDDFHYMPREVQSDAAKSLKEAVRREVKVVTASVIHRGDDLVRANPELRGRVKSIDLVYWKPDELAEIGRSGFQQMNIDMAVESINALVLEAAGSPQLMQSLCLNACFVLGKRQRQDAEVKIKITPEDLETIYQQTSANTDFRSFVDVIDAGPRTRGTERKLYDFHDATNGDVYRAVLKAVAADPPRLSFNYDELTKRVGSVCTGETPTGASIISTCTHISKLALEKFPTERAIDWDEQKFIMDIPDPYLLFYLRWSGRLTEQD